MEGIPKQPPGMMVLYIPSGAGFFSINRYFRLCDGVLRATCLTYMFLPFTKKGGL